MPVTGSNPDDMLFQASVDDKTTEFFNSFNKRVDDLSQKVEKGFSKTEKGLNAGGAAIAGAIGGLVGGVANQVLEQIGNIAAQVRGLITESTMLAARSNSLGAALNIVGANAGYTTTEIAAYEEGLRKTGITILAAKQSLTQMIQANLKLEDSAKLARVAQDAAVIAGVNSSQAFQTILHGITTLQPEILRTLGLVVNMQQEISAYGAKTGKTAEQISYTERQQIALNAVMKAGQRITGAYEASLTETGKKLTSLDRYIEDTKIMLGEAFEPALGVGVDVLTAKLKDLQKWFEENKDEVELFAQKTAEGAKLALQALEGLFGILVKIGGFLPIVIQGFTNLFSTAAGIAVGLNPKEIEERQSNMGQRLKELVSLIAGAMAAAVTAISDGLEMIKLQAQGIVALLKLDTEEADQFFEASAKIKENQAKHVQESFNNAVQAVAQFTGAVQTLDQEATKLPQTLDQAAIAAEALQAALTTAGGKLNELALKMQEDEMELAVKAARDATEAALRESFRQEDLARQHAERVAAILQGASQAKQQAAQQLAQSLEDIERDHQRRIRDLQRDFDYDAEELARARDAVGLLRRMRQHKKDLADEQTSYRDRKNDARAAFEQQMADIDANRKAQLDALKRQEAEQEEEYQRGLDRQRQIQALHDQWAAEDRKKKYAKALADLIKSFKSMDGMTEQGLNGLLEQWRAYFGNLVDMALSYMNQVQNVLSFTSSGLTPSDALSTVPTVTLPPMPGPTGQMGLVSQMLADVGRYRSVVSRVPPTNASAADRSKSKEIKVHVDGSALDPYIQRQVAATLYEIERNAGSA